MAYNNPIGDGVSNALVTTGNSTNGIANQYTIGMTTWVPNYPTVTWPNTTPSISYYKYKPTCECACGATTRWQQVVEVKETTHTKGDKQFKELGRTREALICDKCGIIGFEK